MHFDTGDPGIVFIGDSPMLVELRSELVERGFRATEQADASVLLAVADEDVLDGLCTPQQGQCLATARAFGLECLPVTAGRDRLTGTTRESVSEAGGIAQQA